MIDIDKNMHTHKSRLEEILDEMDSLAADTAELAKLKKQSRNIVCVAVCNEAIDANNRRAEELLKELRELKQNSGGEKDRVKNRK